MARTRTHTAIEQLFEKLAWPYDPAQVAQAMGRKGALIHRGQRIVDAAGRVGSVGAQAAGAAGRGLERALAPATAEGTALAGELQQVGAGLMRRPSRLHAIVGAAALAPILADGLHRTQQKREDELMDLRMTPERGFEKLSHANLDNFLAKKASAREMLLPAIQGQMSNSFTEGIGKGIGGGVANAIIGALRGTVGSAYDHLIVDPKRQKLFESVTRSDPVVSDAVSRNPHAAKTLAEAYQTMVRFAPSLSLYVNAVRSFLREAVVGGAAGVNYATIKSLIETEKAHSSKGGGMR